MLQTECQKRTQPDSTKPRAREANVAMLEQPFWWGGEKKFTARGGIAQRRLGSNFLAVTERGPRLYMKSRLARILDNELSYEREKKNKKNRVVEFYLYIVHIRDISDWFPFVDIYTTTECL